MATRNSKALAWDLGQKQHGVVARRQLLALGFTPEAIKHRQRRGRLHPAGRGVYAIGRPELSREGRWMAAILACGEGAVLSHRSAAALYEVGKERPGIIEVTIRRRGKHQRPGIRVRSRPHLPPDDVGTFGGVPVTSPVRTMLDLATVLDPQAIAARPLERAVNDADKRDVIDPEALRAALDNRAGEPGVRALRALLDRHTFRLSDSELEILFRPIAREAGLPRPLTKHRVNGFEVDFYWPDLGLVVETDGLRYHRTPAAQSRDALRDQTHTAAGFTTLRFSHWQVKNNPTHVLRVHTQTAAHLQI